MCPTSPQPVKGAQGEATARANPECALGVTPCCRVSTKPRVDRKDDTTEVFTAFGREASLTAAALATYCPDLDRLPDIGRAVLVCQRQGGFATQVTEVLPASIRVGLVLASCFFA